MKFSTEKLMRWVGGGREAYSRVLQYPLLNPPAAKFASQGDVHVRIDAKIKFLYYPDSEFS